LDVIEETLIQRGTTVVKRLVLEPGEATPWHTDPYHRVTVIVRGKTLAIEYRDGEEAERVEVSAGQAEWDEPSDRVHRAVNLSGETYEQVMIVFLDHSGAIPQPIAK
jgi:quercetin dioxygenase-like cupin family protein